MTDLILYFVLAYAFTWTAHGAIVLLGIPMSLEPGSPAVPLYMLGLLGPLVGALVVTGRRSGRAGVRALLASGLRWRFSPLWYAVALLYTGAVLGAGLGLHVLIGGDPPERIFAPPPALPLLLLGQVWVVVGEEYGWRGFALPRLQSVLGSLGASLVLGLLWAAWHLPMFIVPGSPQFGASFGAYAGAVTGYTIVHTLLYNRTGGSVFACMVFHAALNGWAFSLASPPEEAQASLLGVGLAATLIAVALLPRPWLHAPR